MSVGAKRAFGAVAAVAGLLAAAGLVTRRGTAAGKLAGVVPADSIMDQVLRGRYLVISHDCAGCHGGVDPNSPVWLAGVTDSIQIFKVGACNYVQPDLKPCFVTRPRNLTPDNATGLGRYSERQIFNALRYGLRMEDTPDVEITSSTPGQGNFPEHPHFVAPPMPWYAWRHMPEADLWAIAVYLHRAVKPVANKVADSEGPPDFWASTYTIQITGAYPAPAFPAASEQAPK
jgi:hypothetical protein